MEATVYRLRQFVADTGYFSKILHACASNTLQTAKMFEQCLPAFGTESGDILEWRPGALFCPARTMTTDGETVCFIAYLQNQVQG